MEVKDIIAKGRPSASVAHLPEFRYIWGVHDGYEYALRGFDDELDEYLFENHQVKSGCCSSVENLKYQIAREVAEKMISQFYIPIQYVSQEERRKKMNEMYGVNLIKTNKQ